MLAGPRLWGGAELDGDKDRQVAELLRKVRQGDQSAPSELIPLVYAELRSVAARCLRRQRPGHTLQPTALVNEAYLRMFGNASPPAADKAHFLAMASQMMRRILVDYARKKGSAKRGGNARQVDGTEFAIQDAVPLRLLELDLAIEALGEENPRFAQAIELHYFGGLDRGGSGRSDGPYSSFRAPRFALRPGLAAAQAVRGIGRLALT